MSDDDLNELLDDTLVALLFQQMTKHVPDDERVGILSSAYGVGHGSPGAIYPDVEHRLPLLTRRLGGCHVQATFGRHGGIRITNRIGDEVSTGVWTNGTFEAILSERTADTRPPRRANTPCGARRRRVGRK